MKASATAARERYTMTWIFAVNCSAFGNSDLVGVVCGETPVALYRMEDGYFATSDRCPHQGAALSQGCVVKNYIECPLHFALFDIRTGQADGGVTTKAVRAFATRVEGDEIYVDLPT